MEELTFSGTIVAATDKGKADSFIDGTSAQPQQILKILLDEIPSETFFRLMFTDKVKITINKPD